MGFGGYTTVVAIFIPILREAVGEPLCVKEALTLTKEATDCSFSERSFEAGWCLSFRMLPAEFS